MDNLADDKDGTSIFNNESDNENNEPLFDKVINDIEIYEEQEEDADSTDGNDAQPENEDNQPIIVECATTWETFAKKHIDLETVVDAFKLLYRLEMFLNQFKFLLRRMRYDNYRIAEQQKIVCPAAVKILGHNSAVT